MSAPLYDGRAALRHAELRGAKGTTHVATLRVLIGSAIESAEAGETWDAVGAAKHAAEYARRLGRELTTVAKKMEDAAQLADDGFSVEAASDVTTRRPIGGSS